MGKDLYKIGPYVIRCTDSSALLSSWSEETYRLKDICEPRKGLDHRRRRLSRRHDFMVFRSRWLRRKNLHLRTI